MYIAQITLFSIFCVISEQTSWHKDNKGIKDITTKTIPATTTQVFFNSNKITFVPANYFKNLPSLDLIAFSYNRITDIADSAFSAVPMVRKIYLNNNKLSIVRQHMFSGLPNLTILYLSSNKVHTIEPGSFKDLRSLTTLRMPDNSMETVSLCIFDPRSHPTNLYITMEGNPLKCDSSICWLHSTWITVDPYTECDGPTALSGQKWSALTEQDLLCDAG